MSGSPDQRMPSSRSTLGDLPAEFRIIMELLARIAIRSNAASDTQTQTVAVAKRNYLVEGLSGAGKSSVYRELIRRGYKAISTDSAWAYHAEPDTGFPEWARSSRQLGVGPGKGCQRTRMPGTRSVVRLWERP
jgi:hypothetical protein